MASGQRQAARSQAARENIVQSALTVFGLKGYAAASMDDVCLAAGCSKGGLYHHFRTKRDVLSAVVERLVATGAARPPDADDGTVAGPTAAARVLLDVWAEAARDAALRGQLASDVPGDEADAATLARLLRMGAMVEALALVDEPNAVEAARRLGIERAA
jgi:AcrR family transcriptional regulator